MPCSYACKATVKLAKKIMLAIKKEEPEFVDKINTHLKLPFLVFYERKFYAFKGYLKNNRLYYKEVYFIGQMPENNLFENILKKGNCLYVEDKDVVVLRNARLIHIIKHQKQRFLEVPFIVEFN